jgi:hypothetical protein
MDEDVTMGSDPLYRARQAALLSVIPVRWSTYHRKGQTGTERSQLPFFVERYARLESVISYVGTHICPARFLALASRKGRASQEELDATVEWARALGERPDAFAAMLDCAAVGWVSVEPN